MGKFGDRIWEKMGDKYYKLSVEDLFKEADRMCSQLMWLGPMKPSKMSTLLRGQKQMSYIVRQGLQANKVADRDRELHELPRECSVPHFQIKKLVGNRGTWYKQRLVEQKVKFCLSDGEIVLLLWHACQRHPRIINHTRESLAPNSAIDKMYSIGSDWLLASMISVAREMRSSLRRVMWTAQRLLRKILFPEDLEQSQPRLPRMLYPA